MRNPALITVCGACRLGHKEIKPESAPGKHGRQRVAAAVPVMHKLPGRPPLREARATEGVRTMRPRSKQGPGVAEIEHADFASGDPGPCAAAAWYGSVLGAVEQGRVTLPGGRVLTVELRFGISGLAIGDEFRTWASSPR